MPLVRRRPGTFDLQVQDMNLRITAPESLYEEARAAALSVWEQLASYSVRNPLFRTSKRPLYVTEDAPAIVREMATVSRQAGVGPVFTLQGAVTEHVGRWLLRSLPEVLVSNAGDFFIVTRRRSRLAIHSGPREGEEIAIMIGPDLGPVGVYTTVGRLYLPAESVDGLAVLARSCILADAAAAATMAILAKPRSFRSALAYLQGMDGVHGAVVIKDDRIGVAGSLELAA